MAPGMYFIPRGGPQLVRRQGFQGNPQVVGSNLNYGLRQVVAVATLAGTRTHTLPSKLLHNPKTMTHDADVIVIGGGHNGLTAAWL